jgi:GNAT superfamily N-acetyltransferase
MGIEFSLTPSAKDIDTIYQGIRAFNLPNYPDDISDQAFALFVRDKNKQIIGGMTGTFILTSLSVKYLWLDESIRGSGIGSELVTRIESEAIERGVNNIYLDTFTFQAPKFYEQLGFKEVGRYTDFPLVGVDRVFYQKKIVSDF